MVAYPDTAYLLRTERRFRVRDASGAIDPSAIAMVAKLLPTAARVAKREQLLAVVARLKAAVAAAGPTVFAGIPVAVEYPAGATRSGTAPDGTPWSHTMTVPYGFLPDTIGMDGDELDVFLGPDEGSPWAFVVVCVTGPPPGNWELKLMLGWLRAEEAEAAFKENVPAQFFDGIYQVPVDLVLNLLNIEFVEAGALKKSLALVAKDDGALVTLAGGAALVARVSKSDRHEGENFFEHARAWVTNRGLLEADSDYEGELGRAVLRMAEVFSAEEHSGMSARFARAYFNWIVDAWEGVHTMTLTPDDFEKAKAAIAKMASAVTKAIMPSESVQKGADYTMTLRTSGVGHDAIKALLANLQKHGGGGHSFGIIADETTTGAELVPKSGEKIVLGGWDGDGGAFAEILGVERTEKIYSRAWHEKAIATYRRKAALDSATLYQGETIPIDQVPELAEHPARTAPLSGTYDDPFAVGGWLGWIEPETGQPASGQWIAFVAIDGRTLLWTQRTETGAVMGTPVEFQRDDLAAGASAPLKALVTTLAKKRRVPILPIAKDAATAPPGLRLIHGIVLEPEPNGGAGDAHDETYSGDIVRNAAHGYLLWHQNMTDEHGRFFSKQEAAPVESFIAPCDYTHNGTLVRQGSWVVVTKVFDDRLWERVCSGELNAYSIGGYAERRANL